MAPICACGGRSPAGRRGRCRSAPRQRLTSAVATGGNAQQAAAAATPQGLVDGFHAAFYVGAATALVGLVCTVLLIRREPRTVHI